VNALYPLILLGIIYLFQNILGLKTEERFSKGFLVLKLAAVLLLCVGGFFAR